MFFCCSGLRCALQLQGAQRRMPPELLLSYLECACPSNHRQRLVCSRRSECAMAVNQGAQWSCSEHPRFLAFHHPELKQADTTLLQCDT